MTWLLVSFCQLDGAEVQHRILQVLCVQLATAGQSIKEMHAEGVVVSCIASCPVMLQKPGPWSADFCTALVRALWRRATRNSMVRLT